MRQIWTILMLLVLTACGTQNNTYSLVVRFKGQHGLKAGDNVLLNGAEIGVISNVQLKNDDYDQVYLTLSIKDSIKLRENCDFSPHTFTEPHYLDVSDFSFLFGDSSSFLNDGDTSRSVTHFRTENELSRIQEYHYRQFEGLFGRPHINTTDFQFLFKHYDNPVEIAVPGIRPDSLEFFITDCCELKQIDNHYTIRPIDYCREITISPFFVDNKDTIMLGSKTLRVLNFPKPTLKLAGHGENIIFKNHNAGDNIWVLRLYGLGAHLSVNLQPEKIEFKTKSNETLILDKNSIKTDSTFYSELDKFDIGETVTFPKVTYKLPDGTLDSCSTNLLVK